MRDIYPLANDDQPDSLMMDGYLAYLVADVQQNRKPGRHDEDATGEEPTIEIEIEQPVMSYDDGEVEDDDEDKPTETPPIPDELPIVPLRGLVVFPLAGMPLAVGQERSLKLIDDAMRGDRLVGLVAQKDPEVEQGGPDDTFRIGTVARVAQLIRLPDGTMRIFVQGLERIAIDEYTQEKPYLRAKIHVAPETTETGVEMEALKRNAVAAFQRIVSLVQYLPDELSMAAMNIEDPRQVVSLIATTARLDLDLRQELLELDSVRAKLEKLNQFLTHELEVLELGKRIQSQAEEEMGKAQREYFLREQLKAIQRELGEASDEQATVNELRERIQAAGLPEEALKEANRELSRLDKLPAASPEYSVIRTYLELLVALPWSTLTGEAIDIPKARHVLDEDHYDLDKVKDRILEYLAVRKLKETRQGSETGGDGAPPSREPILCFVGPPGVGKTSLGQSIARALGRSFVRMSLGGIRDEAEIRGHRRTYIGALPGRILQSLRRAGTRNPVFMLDEVDKVGSDWRGDPSSALLEVLDPEQNHSFRDNYLDLSFDLSQVMFIATANSLEPIPPALLDRMEVIQIPGYTEEQKLHIARRYLVPKEMAAAGLKAGEVVMDDDALRHVVRDYTREAGVRNLERRIADICRKAAKSFAEDNEPPMVVSRDKLRDLLGRPLMPDEMLERIDRPGVVAGLSVTPYGGEVLIVEAAMMPSHDEKLVLTGQLGEVMRESAQAALTYVRSNADALGLDPMIFSGKAVHIHVPAGGIPKDGPSAGVTMVSALVSLATGRRARSDIAMTGEISLRGKVLPIGGLRDKALAAHRMGITTVIFPKGNEPDLDEFPKEARGDMHFIPVEDARQVLAAALEPIPDLNGASHTDRTPPKRTRVKSE
jgi:ATP-dependent Lon protease